MQNMGRLGLLACLAPLVMFGISYGQSQVFTAPLAQFWLLTEDGNQFIITGPPPDRLPGFDTSPHIERELLSLSSILVEYNTPVGSNETYIGPGAIIDLPPHNASRTFLKVSIFEPNNSVSNSLYSPVLLGDLDSHSGQPYFNKAKISGSPLDLLSICNSSSGSITVKCVDSTRSLTLTPVTETGYGNVLSLPSNSRTIIHFDWGSGVGGLLEIMFSCPECKSTPKAYYGSGGWNFREYGWTFGGSGNDVTIPTFNLYNPRLGTHPLKPLGYDSIPFNGITVHKDGGVSCTPNLGRVPNTQIVKDTNTCSSGTYTINAVQSNRYQTLMPGWNLVNTGPASSGYIIIDSPGSAAKLQVQRGTSSAFSKDLVNKMGHPVTIFNHHNPTLFTIPDGGKVSGNTQLTNAQNLQRDAWTKPYNQQKWITGISFDGAGGYPPYKVKSVGADSVIFRNIAALSEDEKLFDLNNITSIQKSALLKVLLETDGGLIDSEIYDIRNDKFLRSDVGEFILWDGTIIDRIYVKPFLDIDNPLWSKYGVTLDANTFKIVENYAFIPIIKPTYVEKIYVSSLPCGGIRGEEKEDIGNFLLRAHTDPTNNINFIWFFLNYNFNLTSPDIKTDNIMQQIYLASRTYLDYLDGKYLAGESISVPILPNREYICMTITPNIVETQLQIPYIPLQDIYLSLSGKKISDQNALYTKTVGGTTTKTINSTVDIYHGGIQVPRTGVVTLNIESYITAAFEAIEYSCSGITPRTSPWITGAMLSRLDIYIDGELYNPYKYGFDVNLARIETENYPDPLPGDNTFKTLPGKSDYETSTVLFEGVRGEYKPLKISIRSEGDSSTMTIYNSCGTSEEWTVHYDIKRFVVKVN